MPLLFHGATSITVSAYLQSQSGPGGKSKPSNSRDVPRQKMNFILGRMQAQLDQ